MKRIRLTITLLFAVVLSFAVISAHRADASEGTKLVALTFDDGPGPYTMDFLDALAERDINVTFFMQGYRARLLPDVVKRAYQDGHQIACHSWNHPDLTTLSASEINSQFSRCYAVFDEICGEGTTYLTRAPYGSSNEFVRAIVNTPFIRWSVDTLDWAYRDSAIVKANTLKDVTDGAIVLMHDIHATTIPGALAAIDALRQEGYEFVTVNELFRRRGVTLENGGRYFKCKPNGTDLGPVTTPEITSKCVYDRYYVTITAQAGAQIYYNTTGEDINQTSQLYTGTFEVEPPCTIYAVAAFNLNGSRSKAVNLRVEDTIAAPPTMEIKDGVMTLTNNQPGTTLYYYTSGAVNTNAAMYTKPVQLRANTMIKAVAMSDDCEPSEYIQVYYPIHGSAMRYVSATASPTPLPTVKWLKAHREYYDTLPLCQKQWSMSAVWKPIQPPLTSSFAA